MQSLPNYLKQNQDLKFWFQKEARNWVTDTNLCNQEPEFVAWRLMQWSENAQEGSGKISLLPQLLFSLIWLPVEYCVCHPPQTAWESERTSRISSLESILWLQSQALLLLNICVEPQVIYVASGPKTSQSKLNSTRQDAEKDNSKARKWRRNPLDRFMGCLGSTIMQHVKNILHF